MEEIIQIFPGPLRSLCRAAFQSGIEPEEIRLRLGQPVITFGSGKEYFWNLQKGILDEFSENVCRWTKEYMKETLARMTEYSMYALEEELCSGFFTIRGGHRIGIVGRTVCRQGKIHTIQNISGLNIRIARQKKGCAKKLLPYLYRYDSTGKESIYNTLILSGPGVGKTTMLRDCIRQLSNGGLKVGVVDERSEIAASFFGVVQNDLGNRTDVLDCCPKAEGMKLLLRSMSPQIIAVDELGGAEDCLAVEEVLHCGCRMLGTIHAERIEELKEKKYLERWLEKGFFERFVLLQMGKEGERCFHIYDSMLQQLC